MDKIRNIHPGEVLEKEFLEPLGISRYRLAKDIHVREIAISEIVKGRRGISIIMALKLSKYFDTSPQFWLNLQNDYEIEEEKLSKKNELDEICPYSEVRKNRTLARRSSKTGNSTKIKCPTILQTNEAMRRSGKT